MSHERGSITPLGRGKTLTQQSRSDEAKRAIEEQRVKALWFMYRTHQMEAAEMLGLSPAAALSPDWREHLAE